MRISDWSSDVCSSDLAGIMAKVDLFEASGMTRSSAVASVAGVEAVSSSTLWNWQRLIEGVAAADRLPPLAPRRQGGGTEAEIAPDARSGEPTSELQSLMRSPYAVVCLKKQRTERRHTASR